MAYKGLTQEQLARLCASYRRYAPACVKPQTLLVLRCLETFRGCHDTFSIEVGCVPRCYWGEEVGFNTCDEWFIQFGNYDGIEPPYFADEWGLLALPPAAPLIYVPNEGMKVTVGAAPGGERLSAYLFQNPSLLPHTDPALFPRHGFNYIIKHQFRLLDPGIHGAGLSFKSHNLSWIPDQGLTCPPGIPATDPVYLDSQAYSVAWDSKCGQLWLGVKVATDQTLMLPNTAQVYVSVWDDSGPGLISCAQPLGVLSYTGNPLDPADGVYRLETHVYNASPDLTKPCTMRVVVYPSNLLTDNPANPPLGPALVDTGYVQFPGYTDWLYKTLLASWADFHDTAPVVIQWNWLAQTCLECDRPPGEL